MTLDGFITILIADDQEYIRASLKLNLARLPRFVVVAEAGDGAAAFKKALDLTPHVVVMDIGMPVMDGIEATRLIKLRIPSVKVLIWSAHHQDSFVAAAVAAGADGFCVKSSPMRLLDQAIRSVAEGAVWFDPQVAEHVVRQMTGVPRKAVAEPSQLQAADELPPKIFGAAN